MTAWWLYSNDAIRGGQVVAAARPYWPPSPLVELWDFRARCWVDWPHLADLAADSGWQPATEADVATWITSN